MKYNLNLILFGLILLLSSSNSFSLLNIIGQEKKYKITIFISATKDLIPKVKNKSAYKIVVDSKDNLIYKYPFDVIYAGKDSRIPPMISCNSEATNLYYIWKYYRPLPKYVGFVHYTKYFDFLNKIPKMDKLFDKNEILLHKQKKKKTLKEYYLNALYENDLRQILQIINDKFPDFYKTANNIINTKIFYQRDLFIMEKNDFLEYGEFVFGVFKEFGNIFALKSIGRVREWDSRVIPASKKGISTGNCKIFIDYTFDLLNAIFYTHQFKKIKNMEIKSFNNVFPRTQDEIPSKAKLIFPKDNDPNWIIIKKTNYLFYILIIVCAIFIAIVVNRKIKDSNDNKGIPVKQDNTDENELDLIKIKN